MAISAWPCGFVGGGQLEGYTPLLGERAFRTRRCIGRGVSKRQDGSGRAQL